MKKYSSSSFILLSQDGLGYSGSCGSAQILGLLIFSISVKNAMGILVRIALNLKITLGVIDI